MGFLNDDGTLVIAQWAERAFESESGDEVLNVHPGKPGHVPMYGTRAMADALVSNGLLGVDLIRIPAGEGFAPHTHPGDHLLIVVGGRGTITYEGTIYPTKAGEVYLIEGSIPHAVGAITDHAILAVGSPHRHPAAADRMTLTDYAAVAADLGTLHCLTCDATGRVDELRAIGCPHTPADAGNGRPLVVGLAPASSDQSAAFVGTQSGDRLARLLDLSGSEALPNVVDTANLCTEVLADWTKTPLREWRGFADDLLPELDNRVVIACGSTVAEALTTEPPLTWGAAAVLEVPGGKPALLVMIPHPSGLSRTWNDQAVADRCRFALALTRTFARCGSPRGVWGQPDADAFTEAVMATG